MKAKILNIALIITSLFGCMEWGGSNSAFVFQSEWIVFSKFFIDPLSVVHPLVLLPLLGQVLLLISIFQRRPKKALVYTGAIFLTTLIGMILLVGVLAQNYKIIISVIPFIVSFVLTFAHYRKERVKQKSGIDNLN